MKNIFVYGTLKHSGRNHHHLVGQKFLGVAHTALGCTLYQLTGYPGMVADPADTFGVIGELWSVDDACLALLDKLEGLAEGLYHRTSVKLLPPFDAQSVETYFYARSVEGRIKLGEVWKH